MGIGVSVFLIALGAILAFAVDYAFQGIDIATIGVILMIAGAIGLVVALSVLNGWGRGVSGGTVVEDDYVEPTPRRVVRRRSYVD
ncbi:MAG TPA: DUF6458 family protein [Acidimicrobiales bacterium]|jgi:hypothetical protein|nr:DUF6458 family protein [Acidimicrobiales bacterium]